MVKIAKGFKNLEVGDGQTLLIKKATFDAKFQKLRVTFADAEGGSCTENFNFLTSGRKPNEVALGIFSTIFKCATHQPDLPEGTDVDPEDMVGCWIVADVFQQVVKDEDGDEKGRYIHVRNFKEAEVGDDGAADDEDLW